MKIIFLDFDGVLNHENYYNERINKKFIGYPEYPYSEFDKDTILNLNKIVLETNAKVVITSTWRQSRTIEELQKLLNYFGFIGEIIDVTPSLRNLGDHVLRGNEIYKWIIENVNDYFSFNEYVILDDDIDMLYYQRNNFIKVNSKYGLTSLDAKNAIKILNKNYNHKKIYE